MDFPFRERIRAAFAPPSYLALPLSGMELSTSGVKAARLIDGPYGLTLESWADTRLPPGAYVDGEIVDHDTVVKTVLDTAGNAGISACNVALPESKSYLFEALTPGNSLSECRTAIEQRIDELVPLPPSETVFDIVKVGGGDRGETFVAGVGFARRIIDDTLSVFDKAGVGVRSLEGEMFAAARALLPRGDESTVLIVDVGRSTTKVSIVSKRIPRFATTIGIGGHSLTLAVQKHFGVTEAEARKIKYEKGIVPAPGNEDYLAAMLSTVSAIRDEISSRLEYWQDRSASSTSGHSPVTKTILIGGNASVRGFTEYLEGALKIPVIAGDVFTNLASRDAWIPELDYNESLAYTATIGLALRDDIQPI